jgi:hypothetical protein
MGDKKKGAPGAPTKVQEGPNGTIALDGEGNHVGSKDWFREAGAHIMLSFESNFYEDVDLHPSNKIEFWVYLCYEGFALFVIIPIIWLVLGMATAGVLLWPLQVREYLFVQKDTAVSRSDSSDRSWSSSEKFKAMLRLSRLKLERN